MLYNWFPFAIWEFRVMISGKIQKKKWYRSLEPQNLLAGLGFYGFF